MPRASEHLPPSRRQYVRQAMPEFVDFQHPRLVDVLPSGQAWLNELKLDGYRLQLRVEHGAVRVHTRNAFDWTDRFPEIVEEAESLPDCILDGELCALDAQGRPDFSALRASISPGRTAGLVLFLFDVLWHEGEDLRPYALSARKAVLAKIMAEHATERLRVVGEAPGGGVALLEAACRMGLEGVVAKRRDAPYRSGRGEGWLKVKCRAGQEVVIGGWTQEPGRAFRALLSGVYEDGKLRYAGSIKTGFSGHSDLLRRLQALETDRSPFEAGDPPGKTSKVHWVRPELVANVDFAEWTASGKLRQASFKGLREDKRPMDVVRERAAGEEPAAIADQTPPWDTAAPGHPVAPPRRKPRVKEAGSLLGVPIENPHKVLWRAQGGEAAITKFDLAEYYVRVSEWLLPYVRGRPCTLLLAPDGVDASTVDYQRHEDQRRAGIGDSPFVRHMTVAEKGKTYPVFDDAKSLVAAANFAAVELHPWNSAPDAPMLPERLVFDLDPDEGQTFAEVVAAAGELESRLLHLGLLAWHKTSGRRGIHVVVPFEQSRPAISWAQAKAFAEQVCRDMAADSPSRYTVALPKAERRGRLFLDYLRNDPGHHAVGLLSPRATPGATVSMPVDFRELTEGANQRFTIRNAVELMRAEDRWKWYNEGARPLASAIDRLKRGGRG